MTLKPARTGTHYFTALHRNAEEFGTYKSSGLYQGTEIAIDQMVAHLLATR